MLAISLLDCALIGMFLADLHREVDHCREASLAPYGFFNDSVPEYIELVRSLMPGKRT